MRDVLVALFIAGGACAALRRPWLGVLALAMMSYMNPHAYAWGWMRTFPAYYVLFLAVALAFVTAKDKQPLPRDWRVAIFFALWTYFFITTFFAMVPEAAWSKLWFVCKIFVPFIFTLKLITTRERLYWLICTIGGSIGLLAAKGGLFAIASGFSYRVYGPPATQFAGNNEFAVATIISIPLLVLVAREASYVWLRRACYATIPLATLAAISSWSRGALLTLGIVTLLLVWHSRRKWLVAPLLVTAVAFGIGQLPEGWFDRMYTIKTYEEDLSALGRLEAWRDGIAFALKRPLIGAGFEGWLWVTMRDWHSSYVEILAEHGFIAFAMWLSLLFGSMLNLTFLARRFSHQAQMNWVANYSYMLRAALVAYAVGTAFLGLSYWDILYHLIFISVLVRKFAYEEAAALNIERETGARDDRRARVAAGIVQERTLSGPSRSRNTNTDPHLAWRQ